MFPRALKWLASAILSSGLPLGSYWLLSREPSHGPTPLGHGISYAVEDLAHTYNGSGRLYWASVQLSPTEMDLFITPPDPSLANTRWTYRLAHTADACSQHHLEVATNCSLFGAEGQIPQLRRPGSRASSNETNVVDGKVVHWWEHTYMLGFTPDLTPVPLQNKPPPPAEEMEAKWRWAIGSQAWELFDGHEYNRNDENLGRWTAVGLDMPRRTLLLAVVERATWVRVVSELRDRGATHVFFLDGSESSTFAVRGRALTGDWRPVANHLGARAK